MNNRELLRDKILEALIIKKLPDDVCISTMTVCCELDIEFRVNNIAKYIDLNKNSIIGISYGRYDDITTNRSILPRKKLKKKKGKRVFYNQVSLAIMIPSKKEKPINIKLFTNGSIQMTGCKSVENVVDVLEKIFDELKTVKAIIDIKQMKMIDKTFINDHTKLYLNNVNNITIGMINSNFRYPNKIDRLKLFNLLTAENISCKYDPSNHACVNIKFNCADKTISIFVFEKGPIVITGAKNCDHILAGYNFINKYLLSNHFKIIKSSINISDISNLISDENKKKNNIIDNYDIDDYNINDDNNNLSDLDIYDSDDDDGNNNIVVNKKYINSDDEIEEAIKILTS